MRSLFFVAVLAMAGCTNAQPQYSWTPPAGLQSGNTQSVPDKAGAVTQTDAKPQSAAWVPPGPSPDSLAGLSPGKRRDLEIKYKVAMIHAHCSGTAYAHKPYDVTIGPKCERDLTLDVLTEYKMPFRDIWQMKLDKEIAIYELLQQHKITLAQAKAKMSELDVTTNNLMNARIDADYQDDLLESAVRTSSQPLTLQAPSSSIQLPQPIAPIHCDTTVDHAGNGSTNCY